MVGKYTAEEWRSRAYSIRYFHRLYRGRRFRRPRRWLYEQGGFVTMLHAFGALCCW